MIQHLRSDRAKTNRPPDRVGCGRAQRCSEAPEEGFNAQIRGLLAVWLHRLRGVLPQIAARAVSTVHLQMAWGHSTPIGSAPGATV
jgi:hypothetical protein